MKLKYLGKKSNSQFLDYSPELLDKVARDGKVKLAFRPLSSTGFYGVDYWNAYEFSYLDEHNQPIIETLEIKIPANSDFTIESKSLKIYLASFFKRKFKNPANIYKLIQKDLSKLIQSKVSVRKKITYDSPPKSILLNRSSNLIAKNKVVKFEGFRSICPVTSQPDWANIYIHSASHAINPKKVIKILKSFRERADFHEQCVESILVQLVQYLKYEGHHSILGRLMKKDDDQYIKYLSEIREVDLTVYGRFLRRGGIDINPIRSTKKKLYFKNFRDFNQ